MENKGLKYHIDKHKKESIQEFEIIVDNPLCMSEKAYKDYLNFLSEWN